MVIPLFYEVLWELFAFINGEDYYIQKIAILSALYVYIVISMYRLAIHYE